MAGLHTQHTPITNAQLADLEHSSVLDNLQGHILRNHGREHSVHIFLRFRDAQEAKRCIAAIEPHITSAQKQLQEARHYRESERTTSGDVFWCFFLSAAGYGALGIDIPQPPDLAFQAGMAQRRYSAEALKQPEAETLPNLNDPPTETWEPGYRDRIDAMLLLADDEQHNLPWADQQPWDDQVRAVHDYLHARDIGLHHAAEVCAIEYGRIMRVDGPGHPKTRPGKEHFGYVDSRSQPLFLQRDVDEEKVRGGIDRWNPAAGPSLVLVEDRLGGQDAYGSYLVFRKLHQDVDAFTTYLDRLAHALNPQQPEQHRGMAEALVMGRFRDGTPIVLQDIPRKFAPVPNNFDYAPDPRGLRCPFQAHIRRMNPRGETDRSIRTAVGEANKRFAAFQRFAILRRVSVDALQALSERQRLSVDELQGLLMVKLLVAAGLQDVLARERLLEDRLQATPNTQPLYFLAREMPSEDKLQAIPDTEPLSEAELQQFLDIMDNRTQALTRFAVTEQDAASRNYDERRHRIARRAVPYGVEHTPQVGLLFMCYQRDIRQQFEFLQADWANTDAFPRHETRLDAMIGKPEDSADRYQHKWPKQWNSPRGEYAYVPFQSCVTLKGGEYFFAPSRSFLRSITTL